MILDMFSAAGVRPLVSLNGKVNANVDQNLLQHHAVHPLRASPNQPAIIMQDNVPYLTTKRVKRFSTMTELRY